MFWDSINTKILQMVQIVCVMMFQLVIMKTVLQVLRRAEKPVVVQKDNKYQIVQLLPIGNAKNVHPQHSRLQMDLLHVAESSNMHLSRICLNNGIKCCSHVRNLTKSDVSEHHEL